MTPLEYFKASSEGEVWHLHMPTEIHGAFGGVTGGALAAAAIAVARTVKPDRIAAGVDIHFLRGLSTVQATAQITILSSGRSITILRVEFRDDAGNPTTEARVVLAAPKSLRTDIQATNRDSGLLGPPPSDLYENAKPWRKPQGVEIPIIDTTHPRAARVGASIATAVTVPWDMTGDGSEGACLAADLSVGPPVDAVIPRGTWVPHPNPDLSLRFLGPTEGQHLVAIALCREISGGLATVETEVWQQQSLVATGISTSLLLSQS
tara:strand:+ start:399 stop:1190 length:792 start_codon:yes stop_codon:yes gene_type:complete